MMHDAEKAFDDADAHPPRAADPQLSLEMQRALRDLRQAEKALDLVSRKAQRDELTGLPNRVLFADRFMQAAARARRNGHRMALLFLDLDHFKAINDTHGHQVGDWVLKRTSNCLTSAVRESDTVSRHGGDEFLILLTEITQAADAALAASKIVRVLEQTADAALAASKVVSVLEQDADAPQPELTASIGLSIYPDDGTDLDRLIGLADTDMSRNKMQRRAQVVLHAVAAGAPSGPGGRVGHRAADAARTAVL